MATSNTLYPNIKAFSQKLDVALFDLDDSLHEAEGHLFDHGWNHVLRPWGLIWRIKNSEDQVLVDGGKVRALSEDERPGIGVKPRKCVDFFIKKLGLSISELNQDTLETAGFTQRHIEELLILKHYASQLSEETVYELFGNILERERISFFVQRIKTEGVIPLDGYEEVIRLKEAGFRIGIATNAPLEIATAVLEKLQLITFANSEVPLNRKTPTRNRSEVLDRLIRKGIIQSENDAVSDYTIRDMEQEPEVARRGAITSRQIDVIVSGSMANKPKPDKDPLEMADWIIRWNEAHRVNELRDELAQIKRNVQNNPAFHDLRDKGLQLTQEEREERKKILREYLREQTPGKSRVMFGDSGADARAGLAHGIPVVVRRSPYSTEANLIQAGATVIVDRFTEITPEMIRGEVPVVGQVEGSHGVPFPTLPRAARA